MYNWHKLCIIATLRITDGLCVSCTLHCVCVLCVCVWLSRSFEKLLQLLGQQSKAAAGQQPGVPSAAAAGSVLLPLIYMASLTVLLLPFIVGVLITAGVSEQGLAQAAGTC